MSSTSDHLIEFNEGDNGRLRTAKAFYNFDSGMGINYQVDVTKPEGQMVTIISMADGTVFNQDKKYKVALNSYRGGI